ncbi:MAG: hypothetical protein H3C47_11460 [Candidatus Cloacimonetes bacterium]|nr:hypothetical protein [Candidatus Cloacimonadota bacterium]
MNELGYVTDFIQPIVISVVDNRSMIFGSSQSIYISKYRSDSQIKEIALDPRVSIKNGDRLDDVLAAHSELTSVIKGLPGKIDQYVSGKLSAIEISVNEDGTEILYRVAINDANIQIDDPWLHRVQDSSILDNFDYKYWLDLWPKLPINVVVTVW